MGKGEWAANPSHSLHFRQASLVTSPLLVRQLLACCGYRSQFSKQHIISAGALSLEAGLCVPGAGERVFVAEGIPVQCFDLREGGS